MSSSQARPFSERSAVPQLLDKLPARRSSKWCLQRGHHHDQIPYLKERAMSSFDILNRIQEGASAGDPVRGFLWVTVYIADGLRRMFGGGVI